MNTRLEQIENKIRMSKVINMPYITWDTTIDDRTLGELKNSGYLVEQEYRHGYYVIGW